MAVIKTTAKAFAKALTGSVRSAVPIALTSMAVQGKKIGPDQISRDMTLRSRGFVSSGLRYRKAVRGRLIAAYGMIDRSNKRFTGLVEQEFGRTRIKRAPTVTGSRGGSLKKRISPRYRLKRSTKVLFPQNYKRRNIISRKVRSFVSKVFKKGTKETSQMLMILRIKKYKGLFYLPKEHNIRQGIYRFERPKTGRLQLIHAIGKIPTQRKRPWMRHTNERILRDGIGAKTWKKTMRRFMSDRARRLSK